MSTTTTTTDEPTFDVYVYGSRSAMSAALTCAMSGGKIDPHAEAMRAAYVGTMPARRIASRVCAAAKRAGLAGASPTILTRRIPEIVKGGSYGTMPYGDGDRTIVFVRRDVDLPLTRTLTTNAAKRFEAARPALEAATAMRPRELAPAA